MKKKPRRKSDAKARSRSGPGRVARVKRQPIMAVLAQRRKKQLSAVIGQTSSDDGFMMLADRSRKGHKTGVVVAVTGPQHGISSNPVNVIAGKIRRALNPRFRVAPCVVTDAQGRPIATIDPLTRKRTAL
jgi:hypothetical protein